MSTFPDTVAAFSALPLEVISDERTREEHERARLLGYSAGYAAGARAASAHHTQLDEQLRARAHDESVRHNAQLESALRAFAAATQAAHNRELPVVDECNHQLMRRALELARYIVADYINEPSPDVDGVSLGALSALRRALETTPPASTIRVSMSPQDAAEVREHWSTIEQYLDEVDGDIEIVADDSLARGSAQADYQDGFVDATVETAFDRAARAIEDIAAAASISHTGGGNG
ncbi:FliH/SctL family protein [Timonella sp. A28]|uniref:FliH/SctL family protein n=1 Tax=Timonella sp. A28 TaxID=3442640 RepID=UPI003EBCB4E8